MLEDRRLRAALGEHFQHPSVVSVGGTGKKKLRIERTGLYPTRCRSVQMSLYASKVVWLVRGSEVEDEPGPREARVLCRGKSSRCHKMAAPATRKRTATRRESLVWLVNSLPLSLVRQLEISHSQK